MMTIRSFALLFVTVASAGILWAASSQNTQPNQGKGETKEARGEAWENLFPSQDAECPESKKVGGFIRTSYHYVQDTDALSGAVFASAADAKFKEVAPGASMAVISGDPDKGAHRVFTKFTPGASFPLHTHSSEMHIVVIKGAYLYMAEKGKELRVGPGCYIDIPANARHASAGDPKEGALFYEESAGKFDLVSVEKEKK